jgi:hypothetical protein
MHRFQKWRDLLQAAHDKETIGRLMREYVQTIPPSVASLLPPDCQQALADPDLQAGAVAILHCELAFKGEPQVAEVLHEVAHTYAAASLRMARITKEDVPRG